MKDVIAIDVISGTIYFNYIDKKKSIYTWQFNLTANESEHSLFRALLNHYKDTNIVISRNNIKLLNKNRWF